MVASLLSETLHGDGALNPCHLTLCFIRGGRLCQSRPNGGRHVVFPLEVAW